MSPGWSFRILQVKSKQLRSRSDPWRDQRFHRAQPKRHPWRGPRGRAGTPWGAALCQGWDGDAPMLGPPDPRAENIWKLLGAGNISWNSRFFVWKHMKNSYRKWTTQHNANYGFANLWAVQVGSIIFTYTWREPLINQDWPGAVTFCCGSHSSSQIPRKLVQGEALQSHSWGLKEQWFPVNLHLNQAGLKAFKYT